jgi:hypothetical protein
MENHGQLSLRRGLNLEKSTHESDFDQNEQTNDYLISKYSLEE